MNNIINHFRGIWDNLLFELIYILPALLIAITIHEFFHAFAAYKLGDPTAKYQGRLSLNPLKHLDIVGTIFLLLFRFGWGKPVPIQSMNFKNPKRDTALVSLAGPLSNIVVAIVSSVLYGVFRTAYIPVYQVSHYFINFFYALTILNITLAVLNLLPVYPLDGSKIFSLFLPDRVYFKIISYERYFFLILIVLMFTGILGRIISFFTSAFMFIANYTTILLGTMLGEMLNAVFSIF